MNERDSNNGTLLHSIIKTKSFFYVDFLLRKGIEVDPVNKNAYTPLHYAVFFNDFKTIKSLVKHGADVNLVNGNLKTPLLVAFLNGDLKIFQFFLEKGALIRAFNDKGEDLFLKQLSPSPEIQALYETLYEQEKLKMDLPEHLNKNKTLNPRL